jgi:hypothetical protein
MSDDPTVFGVLDLVSDLIEGGRHSRRTVSRAFRISLPTADRWLIEVAKRIPGVVKVRVGRVAWYERPREQR